MIRAGSRVDEPSRLRLKVAGIGPPPLIRRPSSTNPFNSRRAVLCSFVLSTPPWGTSVWATVSLDSWATSDSGCTRLVQAVETAAGRLPVQGTSLGWRLVTLERSAHTVSAHWVRACSNVVRFNAMNTLRMTPSLGGVRVNPRRCMKALS